MPPAKKILIQSTTSIAPMISMWGPELLPHMDHGLTQIGNRQTFGFR